MNFIHLYWRTENLFNQIYFEWGKAYSVCVLIKWMCIECKNGLNDKIGARTRGKKSIPITFITTARYLIALSNAICVILKKIVCIENKTSFWNEPFVRHVTYSTWNSRREYTISFFPKINNFQTNRLKS